MNGEENSSAGDSSAVSTWLKARGYSQYITKFEQREITMDDLMHLNEEDLRALGVSKLAHIADLLAGIEKLKHKASAPPPVTVAAMPKGAAAFPGLANPIAIKPAVSVSIPLRKPIGAAGTGTASFPPSPARTTLIGPTAAVPPKTKGVKRRIGGGFLVISIILHLIFGAAATYFVVQTVTHRKLTFKSGPPSPNPNERAIEHKVEMVKKQNTMSAPMAMKRIVTTGMSKVALPAMPDMPAVNPEMPTTMEGMGGTAMSIASMGIPGAGNSGGGGAVTMFGLRSAKGDGIMGTFYDLKQTSDRQPIQKMALPKFREAINEFITGGWNPDLLDKYYKSPNKVRLDQLFIPPISDLLGPGCFGEEKNCQPFCWAVYYRGNVIAPDSFRFRFVGGADDWVIVRFNNETGPAGGWAYKSDSGIGPLESSIPNDGYYALEGYEVVPRGYVRSHPIDVNKGQSYSVEILFGEASPTGMSASLLVEVEGTHYNKAANGSPILPLFRTTGDPLPPPPAGSQYPSHDDNAPVWKPAPASMGGFGFH